MNYDALKKLNSGEWGWEEANFTIPSNVVPGDYYVLFVADAGNKIAESDETNNVGADPITITSSLMTKSVNERNPLDLAINDIQAYPNPFTEEIEIRFSIEENSSFSLEIIDIHGRQVKSFGHRTTDLASPQSVRWNGSNDSGKQVASGFYWLRIVSEQGSKVVALQFLK